MVAFTKKGRSLFRSLELRNETSAANRRGSSIVVSEPDPNNWMRKLFEKIRSDHPEVDRNVLYRVFKREVETRLGRDADALLEERLWMIVEKFSAAA